MEIISQAPVLICAAASSGDAVSTLTYVNGYFSPEDLVEWGASVIRDYANVDIGATNTGGFRVDMDAGTITMGDMMTIYPFDNVIKT
ncbi:MAG: 5'-nucleotidase C-terminal domain-containing protein, partial [Desulfotignum sp.]